MQEKFDATKILHFAGTVKTTYETCEFYDYLGN